MLTAPLPRRICVQCISLRPAKRYAAATTAAAAAAAAAAVPAAAADHQAKHYVVVGAGLAGLATAYHLLKQSSSQAPVRVTVYDAVDIGAGGSGAAAGLLHPFSPTGKLLWRAHDAMEAALELLEAAEAAAAQDPGLPDCIAWRTGMLKPATSAKQSQSFWKLYGGLQQQDSHPQQEQPQHQQDSHPQQQQPQHQQQANQAGVGQVVPAASYQLQSILSAAVIDANRVQQVLPGVQLPNLTAVPQQPAAAAGAPARRRQQKAPKPPAGWSAELSAALLVQAGITLQPLAYMQALWLACQQAAAARQDGSSAQLRIQQLSTLQDVLQPRAQGEQSGHSEHQQKEQHPVDAIVVAAGAAIGSLAEIGQQLPITLCQGYTLDMVPGAAGDAAGDVGCMAGIAVSAEPSSVQDVAPPATGVATAYPADAPSLLGSPYLASQGGSMLVVGATKQYDLTAQQALAELGRTVDLGSVGHSQPHQGQQQPTAASAAAALEAEAGPCQVHSAEPAGPNTAAEVSAAVEELKAGAAAAWPGVRSWSVSGIRTGVRALPPGSAQGAVPIAGRWLDLNSRQGTCKQGEQQHHDSSVPVWLLVGLGARGLVYHAWLGKLTAAAVLSNSEAGLPAELLGWRQQARTPGAS